MQLPRRKESFQIRSKKRGKERKKERTTKQPGHFPSTFPITPSNPSRDGRTRTFETNELLLLQPPLSLQSAIERGYQVKVEGREKEGTQTWLCRF